MSSDPQVTVGMESTKVPVTSYRDSFYWRCWECGWLGTGHWSPEAALQEAGRHWNDDHPLLAAPIVERSDMRKWALPASDLPRGDTNQ